MNEPIKPPALTADAEAMRRLCANLERGFREAQPALNAWAQHMIDGAEAMARTLGNVAEPSIRAARDARWKP